jgi:hypothetical protein
MNEFHKISIKCDGIDQLGTKIYLDGVMLNGVRNVEFKTGIDIDFPIVTIEMVAAFEVDSNAIIQNENELYTQIDGKLYKLVE